MCDSSATETGNGTLCSKVGDFFLKFKKKMLLRLHTFKVKLKFYVYN